MDNDRELGSSARALGIMLEGLGMKERKSPAYSGADNGK